MYSIICKHPASPLVAACARAQVPETRPPEADDVAIVVIVFDRNCNQAATCT